MINLVEQYNQASWDLHYSLAKSGYSHPTIAIQDDGFLPDDVTSPYLFYTGYVEGEGQPLYFNQVLVPDFWEIRGDNAQASIFNHDQKRGQIHYAEPKHKRWVKSVDWQDRQGRVRVTDRYNKFGYRYAQSSYNLDGQATLTTYFDKEGREVIVENHQTGDILLNQSGHIHVFKKKTEFIVYYLQVAGFNLDRICYNSLSSPFSTVFSLHQEGEDILFWQEPIRGEIPGNMRLLLDGKGRSTKIVVQDKSAYNALLPLLTEEQKRKVTYLGLLYPFVEKELDRKQALILTNSDQLEGIEGLIIRHPDLQFHIGAITEMSSTLTSLGRYANVHLYPNITTAQIQYLYDQCGIYLDINYQGEILSAVRTAFERQQLILAFEETAHNRIYTANNLIFSKEQIAELDACLRAISTDLSVAQFYLLQQKERAHLATVEEYQSLFD